MRRALHCLGLALALLAPATSFAAWPGITEYNQAVRQHGVKIFGDPALQAGTLRRVGPSIVSHPGGTSVVYDVSEASGKRWAVRCFTLKPPHDRHEAIARALTEGGLTAENGLFPELHYVKNGIQLTVDGKAQWFPIMKMGWVDGKRLERQVHSLIEGGKHAELDQLAEDFRAVHATLRANNIAHGDLQHGNMLIGPNGKLKLVDLDDVFIPSFRGQQSGGAGHQHYAHPARDERDFYLDVDNFSSMVIYVSLKALASDPTLWHDAKIHVADRDKDGALLPNASHGNLVFRRSDFDEPGKATVWKRLAKSASPEVRKLAKQLQEFAGQHVSEVPPLEHVLAGAAWKPDGTVPSDFETVEADEADEASEAEPKAHAPKVVAAQVHTTKPTAPVQAAELVIETAPQAPAPAPGLKEPGPHASAAEWQVYRMKKLAGRK